MESSDLLLFGPTYNLVSSIECRNIARSQNAALITSLQLSRCQVDLTKRLFKNVVTNSVLSHYDFLRCHNLIFFSLSQIEILSFVTIWVFDFGLDLNFVVLSQFYFFSFVTTSVFKYCQNLIFLGLVTIVKICKNLSFWVLTQFEFLSFVMI